MGEHIPEAEEYGVRSWVYRAARPFNARRLHALLSGNCNLVQHQSRPGANQKRAASAQNPFHGVLRSKGFFSVVEEPDAVFIWSSSYTSRTVRRRHVADSPALDSTKEACSSELVFIGINTDDETLKRCLDAAVATALESRLKRQHPVVHPFRNVATTTTAEDLRQSVLMTKPT